MNEKHKSGPGQRSRRMASVGLASVAMTGMLLTPTSLAGAAGLGRHLASNGKVAAGQNIVLTEQDWWGSQPQSGAFDWLFKTYEQTHPGITISRDVVSGSIFTAKLTDEAQAHTLPDIAVADNPVMPQMEATGQFFPLNAEINKWGQWDDYVPSTRSIVTAPDGKIYGIQIGTNDLVMFYNKKIFAEAGITTTPVTWAQLYTDSQQIVAKVKGLTYGAISFGAQTGSCDAGWQFAAWLLSGGAKLSVPDITNPGTVAALTLWAKLVKNGLASKNVLSMCQTTNLPWLEQGKVAMIEDGTWDLATLTADHTLNQIGFFKMPVESAADSTGVPLGGEVWTITDQTPAIEQAAWNFLQWSQQPSIHYQFDNKMDYLALRSSVYAQQEKANPILTPFIQELVTARSRTQYLGGEYTTYCNDVSVAVQQAILGEATPLAALQSAQKAVEAQAGSNG